MTLITNKYSLLVFPLLILFFISGCVTPTSQMSLEEAKKVAIAMEKSSAFVPPPRRIDDILSILDQSGQFESQVIAKFKAQAEAKPPETTNSRTLKEFYRDRGYAAFELYRYPQAQEDFQKALSYNFFDPSDGRIKGRLGRIELQFGNFQKAIQLYKDSSGYTFGREESFRSLVEIYAAVGDLESAIDAQRRLVGVCNNAGDPLGRYWCSITTAFAEAHILETQGKYTEAEIQFKKIKGLELSTGGAFLKEIPTYLIKIDYFHTLNLFNQQRFVEAEFEARRVLMTCMTLLGKKSPMTGISLTLLMRVLQAQGRLEEADLLVDEAIRVLATAGVPPDSRLMVVTRASKGDLHTVLEDYSGATTQYDLVKTGMKDNQFLYEGSLALNPLMVLSLLKTGRLKEAERLASQNYNHLKKRLGDQHVKTMKMVALRGMVRGKLNQLPEAVQDLSVATEALMKQHSNEGESFTDNKLRRIIIDEYLELLTGIKGTPLEKELSLNVAEISFRLAEANRGQSVQSALVAGSARSAVTDPELADLIRKEQDADRQIRTMEESILNLMAAPADQQDSKIVQTLQDNIKNLRLAQKALLEETKKRFPKYTDLVNPAPQSISAIQGVLHPGEAFLSFYATKDKTFVWAIPNKGKVSFATVNLKKDDLVSIVTKFREALDPNPQKLGDIPEFDLASAHDLYKKLFSPVESVLKEATDLFVVANNPLDQIPLAILPTAPVKPDSREKSLFAQYRQVPWLIRKASITMEPSVSAFVNLRTLPSTTSPRKAFVGFGDPLFNRQQLASLQTQPESPKGVQVRGVRVTEKGSLENKKITSIQTENLNRLPDTAEEIRTVAQVLKADLTNDVFLRERASRHQVKTMPLSDRKVIAFATHALVPGDLDGLDQPALALSSPSVTGDQEDGLLTMTDIMKLKLNADWVVLSACNTGSGNGAGAEALSGLGQAFFYAGSRALLASMYPVETTSARKLVTGIFQAQEEDKTLSRSQALRRSMLTLMDKENLKDESGTVIASYAHPLFWAPFIIVGDPGKDL